MGPLAQPPPKPNILQQLENMNLNDTKDENVVIKAQSLLIKYFKPFHKKQMPDIVKQMLETISNLGIENEASIGKFHDYQIHCRNLGILK